MHNAKSFAILATGALILVGVVAWTNSNTEAFAPISTRQIDPLQMMTTSKSLPTQTSEDQTFIF